MNLYVNFWAYERKDDPKGLVRWKAPRHGDDFDPDHPFTIDEYFAKYRNLLCKHVG